MRQKYVTEKNEDYKRILLERIKEEIGNDKEYSFGLQKIDEMSVGKQS